MYMAKQIMDFPLWVLIYASTINELTWLAEKSIAKNSLDKKITFTIIVLLIDCSCTHNTHTINCYILSPPLMSQIIHCQKPMILDHRPRLDASNFCRSVSVLT